jgi:hypothetical protein
MAKKSTPLAVRLARWTAIGTILTLLGTTFQSVWTVRPWWAQPTPIVQTVDAPVAPAVETPKEEEKSSVEKLQEKLLEGIKEAAAEAAADALSDEKETILNVPKKWVYGGIILAVLGYFGIEIRHRFRKD